MKLLVDGKQVDLADVEKVLLARKPALVHAVGHLTWELVESLLSKLKALDPEKVFTVFWRSGNAELLAGSRVEDAFTKAGYGQGAMGAIDFWLDGDARSQYKFDPKRRQWLNSD